MMSVEGIKRKKYLDIAKGVGIILVVWAHASGPGSRYINLFHMPMFFFISGLLFNERNSCEQFILNKIKSLYIPFLTWNLIFYLIEYSLSRSIENKEFNLDSFLNVVFQIEVGVNKSSFLGATWFLAALFWISIIYKCIYVFLNKYIKYTAACIVGVSLISTIVAINITIPYFLSRTIICSLFYSSGFLLKQFMENIIRSQWKIYFAVALFGIFLILNKDNFCNMGQNIYTNKLSFLMGAFIASISVILLSHAMEEKMLRVSDLFAFIGKNSMQVVIWQFVAFIPLFFIQCCIINNETLLTFVSLIIRQHTYDIKDIYWVLYFISGLFLPIIFNQLLEGIKAKNMLRFKREK